MSAFKMKYSLIRYRESIKRSKSLPSRGNRALLEPNDFMELPLQSDGGANKFGEFITLLTMNRVHKRPQRRQTICYSCGLPSKSGHVLKSRKTRSVKKPINPERIKLTNLRQELKILKQENKKWKNILKACDELDVKPEDFYDQIPVKNKEPHLPPVTKEFVKIDHGEKKYPDVIDCVVDNIIDGPCIAMRNTDNNIQEQKSIPNTLTSVDESFSKNLDKYLDSLLESLSD